MNRYCTENPSWGFFGEMDRIPGIDPEMAFDLAVREIMRATNQSGLHVVQMLDARHGRHFADEVHNRIHSGGGTRDELVNALAEAIGRWQTWRISPAEARRLQVSDRLPYLDALIVSFAQNNLANSSITVRSP